jgi:hypothetical protein
MEKLGPTGNFPRGQINPHDEGELTMAVAIDQGIVKLVFGKKVAWLGLPAKEAKDLANLLIEKANELERRNGTT